MKEIYCETLEKVLKNRKALEKRLNIKIAQKENAVYIEGDAIDEHVAERVMEAINLGFPVKIALLIKEEDFIFEIIHIKQFTKRKDLERIRARIIGKKGKTIKTLCGLTKCHLELKDNEVGIIGDSEYIENAQQSIISLIKGSKQANVYKFLEKHQPQEIIDLGLKKEIKNKK
ncbi:MAG: hypothetical protein KKA64_02325 [Nanoarchaeota archaeon]|nr:hypothetical protein [Nanoarchaeota archaeon]